jgi:hypothetical protein
MATIIDPERFRDKAMRGAGGSDGGNVDDILRRLGAVESLATETRADVSAIKAVLPHLSTKADLSSLETKIIRWLVGTLIGAASLAFTIAKFVN